ncbi:lectin like domain-containing protein [Methanosarcina hadiensis]|uniref:lectin like domain-containing protein n=1 Tax=Methanosarcina hadiensis TaxID=3078083 RepID=UPI003977549A
MKENVNEYCKNMKKRVIVFTGLLVLLIIFCSSTVTAKEDSVMAEEDSGPQLAPESSEFNEYLKKDVYQKKVVYSGPTPSLDGHQAGLLPSPLDLSYIRSIPIPTASSARYYSDLKTPDRIAAIKGQDTYYNLRNFNKVTAVKDQGKAGTCWAFASYASMESFLKPGEEWDFSENNMKNLLSSSYSEGFDRDPNDGGNRILATAYLARWNGPVLESDDLYSTSSEFSPESLPVKKHVQDILFIPNRENSLDNEEIKWAVKNYGAVYTTMYYYNNSTYYSPSNYSYYCNGTSEAPNHAVAIIGWDDFFNRNNFSEIPPGDGAFIAKNSWGSDWGDCGYFYISYYDSKAGNGGSVFTAENPDNYEYIYQYDPFGWVSSMGYRKQTAWCANVFTAKSEETLKAVSFYTTDSGCYYEIYIYTNPDPGPVNLTGPVTSRTGSLLTAGYHTIPLDSGVRLTADQNFSVVVRLTNIAYNYPVALEKPREDWSSKAKSNPGESFISKDGVNWTDVNESFENSNVCVKAFTNSVLLPAANFCSNVTEGYVPLSVQFIDLSENSTERNWDFENDGIIDSTEANPVYAYLFPGIYTVNLTAVNENGTDSMLAAITVLEQPVLPVANFTCNVTRGYAPLSVQFTDTSENAAERVWNFGDCTCSTDATVVHTYKKAGKYTVSLKVSNVNGTDRETRCEYITVTEKEC